MSPRVLSAGRQSLVSRGASPRPERWRTRVAVLGWVSAVMACSAPPAAEPPVHPMLQVVARLGGEGHGLTERVEALVAAVTPAQELEGEVLRGRLERGRLVQRSVVLRGTYCYVVFAAGDEGVREVDVELIDNRDVPLVVDRTRGGIALLGVGDTLCPMTPEPHVLRVSASDGEGAFEAHVYRASAF